MLVRAAQAVAQIMSNMVAELWFDSADTVATAAVLLAGEIAEKDDPDHLKYGYDNREMIAKGAGKNNEVRSLVR